MIESTVESEGVLANQPVEVGTVFSQWRSTHVTWRIGWNESGLNRLTHNCLGIIGSHRVTSSI